MTPACAECGDLFTDEEWEDRHWNEDYLVVHARCDSCQRAGLPTVPRHGFAQVLVAALVLAAAGAIP